MKQHLSYLCLLCLFWVSFAQGKPLNFNKASSVDLSKKGFLVVSCGEVPHELDMPPVWIRYFIGKANQRRFEGSFESRDGEIYVFALDPGEYQIGDWKLSGMLSGGESWWSNVAADSPYKFVIEAGAATYIGQILTDVNYHEESSLPTNKPIILDRYRPDIGVISSKFKILQKLEVSNSAAEGFNWLNSGGEGAGSKQAEEGERGVRTQIQ